MWGKSNFSLFFSFSCRRMSKKHVSCWEAIKPKSQRPWGQVLWLVLFLCMGHCKAGSRLPLGQSDPQSWIAFWSDHSGRWGDCWEATVFRPYPVLLHLMHGSWMRNGADVIEQSVVHEGSTVVGNLGGPLSECLVPFLCEGGYRAVWHQILGVGRDLAEDQYFGLAWLAL